MAGERPVSVQKGCLAIRHDSTIRRRRNAVVPTEGEQRASASYVRSQSRWICTRSSGKPYRAVARLEHVFEFVCTARHVTRNGERSREAIPGPRRTHEVGGGWTPRRPSRRFPPLEMPVPERPAGRLPPAGMRLQGLSRAGTWGHGELEARGRRSSAREGGGRHAGRAAAPGAVGAVGRRPRDRRAVRGQGAPRRRPGRPPLVAGRHQRLRAREAPRGQPSGRHLPGGVGARTGVGHPSRGGRSQERSRGPAHVR